MATLNKAKQKEPKAKGLGNKPRTSDSLNDEEIEKLYASKCLGKFSSHYKQFVAKFDLTFQPSRRQTDRESDAGEMSNPSKRQTEKSICCIGWFYVIKRKLHGRLEIRNFSFRVENISFVRVFFFSFHSSKNPFSLYRITI